MDFRIMVYGAFFVLMLGLMLGAMRGKRRPSMSEWKALRGKLGEMSRDDIDGMGLSDPTRSALNIVLTERKGYANKDNVPFALQILDDAGLHAAATVRSLSTMAVFLGLVVTAWVFSNVLGALANMLSEGGDASGQIIKATQLNGVFSHLKIVYEANGGAIFCALIFYAVSRRIEDDARSVSSEATTILNQLPDNVAKDVDPQMYAAMSALTTQIREQFQDGMGEWQEQQLDDIRQIVAEVRGLADSIKDSVGVLRQSADRDTANVLASIRSTQTSVENSAVRLESSLGQIAEQGAPALASLAASAASFQVSMDKFRTAGNDMTTSVQGAAERMESAVQKIMGGIPAAVSESTIAVLTQHHAKSAAAMESLTHAANALHAGARVGRGGRADFDSDTRAPGAPSGRLGGRGLFGRGPRDSK